MSTTMSPNMGLVIPGVATEPGPNWAQEINASLAIIDSHNHSAGQGVQINPSGMNINSDLSFNTRNATVLRSVRFAPLSLPLSAISPDLGCLYESGVDLYYNDGGGNQIRMTQGGAVAGAAGTITGLPSGTASASYSAPQGTFVFEQATATAANMDIGTIILRYPGSYPAPSGNFIQIQAPTFLATGYSVTLPGTQPAANSVLTMDTSGNIGYDSLVPAGVVYEYGGTAAPTGYLMCDGASYLRASYAALFAAIGTAYGAADGTHFNVPDKRGRFGRGVDNGAGHDPDASSRTASNPGGNTGDNVGSLQGDQFASHTHSITVWQSATAPSTSALQGDSVNPQNDTTTATGGNETRPKNVYFNYIIKT